MTRVRIGGTRLHLPSLTNDELNDILVRIAADIETLGTEADLIGAEIDRRKACHLALV